MKKINYKEQLKKTAYLLRNSFTIIGKDEDIKTPMIKMGIYTTILRILFLATLIPVIRAVTGSAGGGVVALMVFFWFIMALILVPMRFFYDVRQKANLSWTVYNTLCGVDISYRDAKGHTKKEKGKIRLLGLGEMIMKYARIFRKDSGILITLILGDLNEVWDLLSHFMLPAVVVEQKKLKEIVPDLKSLRSNVPETLAGVFGLDFAGEAARTFIVSLSTVFVLLSIVAGWLLAFVTDAGVITVSIGPGFAVSWIPIYTVLSLVVLSTGILAKLTESIKVIYFTVFYTVVRKLDGIAEEMRGELTDFLKMKGEEETTQAKSAGV